MKKHIYYLLNRNSETVSKEFKLVSLCKRYNTYYFHSLKQPQSSGRITYMIRWLRLLINSIVCLEKNLI